MTKKRGLSLRQKESFYQHMRMRDNQHRRKEELRLESAKAADENILREHEELIDSHAVLCQ